MTKREIKEKFGKQHLTSIKMSLSNDAPSEIINSPRQLCQYSIVFFSLADRLQAISLGVIRARARNRMLI